MPVRRTALILATCAALAACGGGEKKPTTLPPVATTAAATPSAKPSAAPTGKDAPTAQGAAAFARHYYAEITRAFDERDPSLVQVLSAPGCKTCAAYVGSIALLKQKDQKLSGRLVFTFRFAEGPATNGPTARVDVMWSTPALRRFDVAGNVINDQVALVNHEETVHLRRSGTSWLVTELTS